MSDILHVFLIGTACSTPIENCTVITSQLSGKIHAFFYDSMDSPVENCNNAVLAAKQNFTVQQALLKYIRKPFLKQLKENLASNNSMLKPVQGQLHEICDLLSRFNTIIDDIETHMKSSNSLLVPSPISAQESSDRRIKMR